jgi:hypothetical protein
MAQDFTGQILAHAPVRFSPNMQFPKVLACNCNCDETLETPTLYTLTFNYGAINQVTAIRYTFKGVTYTKNFNEDASPITISDTDINTVLNLQKALRALFGQFLQANGNVNIDTTTTAGSIIVTVRAVTAFVPNGIFIDGVLVAFV